jgi:hypothetical protein
MADYYTLFSFDLKLPNKEAVEYAMKVVSMVERLASESDESRKSLESEFPDELLEFVDDWSYEVVKEEAAIWIHSDYGGVDAACQFVQHLLDRFGITETITFEWANTCSKPRTGRLRRRRGTHYGHRHQIYDHFRVDLPATARHHEQ